MRERHVVTCFLQRTDPQGHDEVLLLRRSQAVGSYRGRWAAVSGSIEDGPLEQAYREIEEETGLTRSDVRLLREGEPIEAPAPELDTLWVVHPFLFHLEGRPELALDWEHTEDRWVSPRQLRRFHTVPMLIEALERVYPPPSEGPSRQA
jgi:8-oxo-dGTP pyrophosphatase MutT (NUDIX family)